MDLTEIRILGHNPTAPGHEERFDWDVDDQCIYIGVAQDGTPTSQAAWYIRQFTYSGGLVTRIRNSNSNAVWDNRTTTFS